jgi:uncharacterized membrane protein
MKGNVLGFDPDSNTGAISGHDGLRYDFVSLEWRGPNRPSRGATVDFIPDGQRATQIFPLAGGQNVAESDTANTVYILYLVNLLLPPVTGIVGVIMAYVNRAEAPEWVQTHYTFQIRTFWIGLLYGLIGMITAIIIVGLFWLMFVLVWWIIRCAKGMQAISHGAPYDRPETWLW